MSVNENETVNQSQSPPAGGSGDSPEKLVADHVENLWEHIAADGYDLLADVAVESLTRNGDVPPDAYLRSVKMSWCLHRAATYYARQYSVERVSADFARGDAQFEHSLRAQAERKAEKLEADLAQSALLVESQRLRLEEARAQGAEWCKQINKLRGSLGARREELTASFTANQELRQKLETAEAALLEQQQRNDELVTQNSQQFMKIAELQRQVEGAKTQELEGQTQELPAEYTPPEGWRLLEVGEPLQNGDQWITESGAVEVLREVKTEIVQPNGHYIRQIQPEVVQSVQVREGRWRTRGGDIRNVTPTPECDNRHDRFPWRDTAYDQTWAEDGLYFVDREESPHDLLEYLGPIEEQSQPQAEPVQVREGRWRTRNGEVKNIRPCEPMKGPYYVWPWTDGFMTFQDNGLHQGSKQSDNDLVEYLGPIEPQVEALTTNRGDDSGGN